MRKKRIDNFITVADVAEGKGFHEVAFAVRYMAYEGVITRVCIKALWLRGATVRDAEKTISSLANVRTNVLLGASLDSGQFSSPVMSYMAGCSYIRNNLFHNSYVSSFAEMKGLSRLLRELLNKYEEVFSRLEVGGIADERGNPVLIGNPFENLKKSRRPTKVQKRSAKAALGFDETKYREDGVYSKSFARLLRVYGKPNQLSQKQIQELCGYSKG